MPYPLTETYKIQMYAGEEPRKMIRTIIVDCWSDYHTVRKYIKQVEELMNELEERKVKLWKLESGKELVEERKRSQQLEQERKKAIGASVFYLNKWGAVDLEDLSDKLENFQKDATSWKSVYELERDKTKGLENDKTQLTTELTNKDKTIQTLQLKNEKLSENNKKLYNYLGDAWKLISHLQKDLQVEKQDKQHIQKELDDALAILNKPTREMETQTDLTAEQITQMEKDIEKYRELLYQGGLEIEKLEQELTDLQSEIKDLQKQLKDKEINKAEKELLVYVERGIETPLASTIPPNELLEKLQNENDWTSLRPEYEIVRQKLIKLTKRELERRDLQSENAKLEKDRGELQTKYDMEVRSKEELVKELNKLRPSVPNEESQKIFDIFRQTTTWGDDRKRVKEELDNIGFNQEKLGSYSSKYFGYTIYYYLYSNWTVPKEWFI